jgi:hypothetical protein
MIILHKGKLRVVKQRLLTHTHKLLYDTIIIIHFPVVTIWSTGPLSGFL